MFAGPAGSGKSIQDIVLMGISGEGLQIAHVDGLYGSTSFAKGAELGCSLQQAPQPVRMVYLLAFGIDIANDQLIAGQIFLHAAIAVGIWDPTLGSKPVPPKASWRWEPPAR